MYPRVRVREQEKEDQFAIQNERSSLLLLKVFESLSLENHGSPGISSVIDAAKDYQNDSPPSITKVPKVYVPNGATPSISVTKGQGKSNKEIDEDTRPNIRASLVPRPRAVLSSPDNDGMIGSRNRLARERSSNLKKHNWGQNTPADGKVKCAKAESPINMRRGRGPKEAVDNKTRLDEKNGLEELTAPRQKSYIRKGKPSSVGI